MTAAELQTIRLDLGITQAELARKTGYSVRTIENMECGRLKVSKRFETVLKLIR